MANLFTTKVVMLAQNIVKELLPPFVVGHGDSAMQRMVSMESSILHWIPPGPGLTLTFRFRRWTPDDVPDDVDDTHVTEHCVHGAQSPHTQS